jgi:sortase (surface protein transpeptidase)
MIKMRKVRYLIRPLIGLLVGNLRLHIPSSEKEMWKELTKMDEIKKHTNEYNHRLGTICF